MVTGGFEQDVVAWGVAGGGMVAWLAQTVWSKFFGADRSNQILLTQLTERISAQEERMITLEREHQTERAGRLEAQTRVRWLELQVRILKAELLRHGIEIPSHAELDIPMPPTGEPHA